MEHRSYPIFINNNKKTDYFIHLNDTNIEYLYENLTVQLIFIENILQLSENITLGWFLFLIRICLFVFLSFFSTPVIIFFNWIQFVLYYHNFFPITITVKLCRYITNKFLSIIFPFLCFSSFVCLNFISTIWHSIQYHFRKRSGANWNVMSNYDCIIQNLKE